MVVAVIAFIVSVPVLSLLMTVVPPRVSTSDSDLTTALCSASRRAPDDSMACTNVGSPVGIAAIAVEMHSSTSVVVSWPRTRPKMAMIATARNAIRPNTLVMPSSSRCSGDLDRWVAVTIPAILPISVALPVAVTTIVAVPRVTWVFWNTRLVRSPSATSPPDNVPASLGIGALSPVSAASCTSSVAEDTIRPSAGTTSPDSSSTMSPGTSVADSICSTCPERRTRACGTCSLASASTLARAFSSWAVPITTLNVTSPSTTTAVAIWTIAKLAATTISSMMFIGLTSWARATTHTLGGGSPAPVRPVLLQPPRRLVGVQPVIRIDTHLPGRVFRGQGVPGEVLGGLLHGGHLSSSGWLRHTRAAAADLGEGGGGEAGGRGRRGQERGGGGGRGGGRAGGPPRS